MTEGRSLIGDRGGASSPGALQGAKLPLKDLAQRGERVGEGGRGQLVRAAHRCMRGREGRGWGAAM